MFAKSEGPTLPAQTEAALAVELFLNENYRFRRNVLNGKVEYMFLPAGEKEEWMPLTMEAINSIIIRAKRQQISRKGSPKTDIMEYIHSNEVVSFNPIADYLDHLPEWDGQNHVAKLFGRLPGITSEQLSFLTIWLRSVVAHWLQMDMLHGNECVPTFIGGQGCGKTTFIRRLLPPELREYYMDHFNLSNKFDKEMALTNNLLVNLDELDAIRPSQQPALKQALSKNKVNGRPIFGTTQEDRPRFASFVATTNNPHPLTDVTGSRRYICLRIPKGQQIDNDGDIDYGQLYAQVLYELRVQQSPYWFNNEEVVRLQQMNLVFMQQKELSEMIDACFRHPNEGEKVKSVSLTDIMKLLQQEYPMAKMTETMKIYLGRVLTQMNFERKEHGHVSYYKIVPLQAA